MPSVCSPSTVLLPRAATLMLLALVLFAAGGAVPSAAAQTVIPQRSLMAVQFNGTRWSEVLNSMIARGVVVSVSSGAHDILVNPVTAGVVEFIRSALSAPPGVTDFMLESVAFDSTKLSVAFTVVRLVGGNEMTDAQISAALLSRSPWEVQACYITNGGVATEVIAALSAGAYTATNPLCSTACLYGVGISVPLVLTALLAIPIFVSLVADARPSFFSNSRAAQLSQAPHAALICCAKHANELCASRDRDAVVMGEEVGMMYDPMNGWMETSPSLAGSTHEGGEVLVRDPSMRSVGATSHEPGHPQHIVVQMAPTDVGEDDGYPATYQHPVPPPEESNEEYYRRVAQEALEAERVRREDENRWRRANNLHETETFETSTHMPRVVIVEQPREYGGEGMRETMSSLPPEQLDSIPRCRPTEIGAVERQEAEEELRMLRSGTPSSELFNVSHGGQPRWRRQEAEMDDPLLFAESISPGVAPGEYDGSVQPVRGLAAATPGAVRREPYVPNGPLGDVPRSLSAASAGASATLRHKAPPVVPIVATEEAPAYDPNTTIASAIRDREEHLPRPLGVTASRPGSAAPQDDGVFAGGSIHVLRSTVNSASQSRKELPSAAASGTPPVMVSSPARPGSSTAESLLVAPSLRLSDTGVNGAVALQRVARLESHGVGAGLERSSSRASIGSASSSTQSHRSKRKH